MIAHPANRAECGTHSLDVAARKQNTDAPPATRYMEVAYNNQNGN